MVSPWAPFFAKHAWTLLASGPGRRSRAPAAGEHAPKESTSGVRLSVGDQLGGTEQARDELRRVLVRLELDRAPA
jgi:hypothetical protein